MEYNSGDMVVVLSLVGAVVLVFLVLLEAMRTSHPTLSVFELRRRRKEGDKQAGEILRREELLVQLSLLKTPARVLLLVVLMLIAVHLLGRSGGVLAMLAVSLFYGRIANMKPVQRLAARLAKRYESRLLGLVSKHEKKIRLLTGSVPLQAKSTPLGSREELVHMLEASPAIFSKEDAKLVMRALSFRERHVDEIMTKKDDIIAVKHNELLGPLVLDDLHKTGHTIFPVMEEGRIIGLLDSSDHSALRTKESAHVRDVMNVDLTYIRHDQTLDEALAALPAARPPLLIVVNDEKQAVGIVSFGDVLQALTGRSTASSRGGPVV